LQQLLEFCETLLKEKKTTFVLDEEANGFLKSNSFAFLMAACLDRDSRAESVWMIPPNLALKLGGLDPKRLISMTVLELERELRSLPKKPHYPRLAAKTILSLTSLVIRQPNSTVETIWRGRSVVEVLSDLIDIHGVGPGIANMVLRILIDEGDYSPSDDQKRLIDIKADVHVTRVFYRSGLSPSQGAEICKLAARELHPEFPAKLDWPAWEIGRSYCRETDPKCQECKLGEVCMKRLAWYSIS